MKFRIDAKGNGTYLASLIEPTTNSSTVKAGEDDQVGALYYVLAVLFIYGCSIVMMIASHIRKNNIDRKLNHYLKEMAAVRKREQQMQLYSAAAKIVSTEAGHMVTAVKSPAAECSVTTGEQLWVNQQRLDSMDSTDSQTRMSNLRDRERDLYQPHHKKIVRVQTSNREERELARTETKLSDENEKWEKHEKNDSDQVSFTNIHVISSPRLQSTSNDSVFEEFEPLVIFSPPYINSSNMDTSKTAHIQVVTSL